MGKLSSNKALILEFREIVCSSNYTCRVEVYINIPWTSQDCVQYGVYVVKVYSQMFTKHGSLTNYIGRSAGARRRRQDDQEGDQRAREAWQDQRGELHQVRLQQGRDPRPALQHDRRRRTGLQVGSVRRRHRHGEADLQIASGGGYVEAHR